MTLTVVEEFVLTPNFHSFAGSGSGAYCEQDRFRRPSSSGRSIVRYPTRSGVSLPPRRQEIDCVAGPSTERSGVSLPGPSRQVAVRSESPSLPATRDGKLSFMAGALPEKFLPMKMIWTKLRISSLKSFRCHLWLVL